MRARLRQAWPAFWILRKQRSEPAWTRILIANALAFSLSAALLMLAGLLRLAWFDPLWWHTVAIPFLCVGVVVGNTLLAVFRALELGIGDAALERLHRDAGWRSGLMLNALAAAGILLGCAIGIGLVSAFYDPAAGDRLADPRQRLHFALFMLVLIGANVTAWSLRARRLARQRRATEAQLHLLQAQIEPQFLFNTLADVQGLLDHDHERARQMLEEFTDYLRASLSQLRRADSTVAAELDMAQSYLQLLQLRMGMRLRFSIEASVQARAAVVPPLLLQPLVENAIRHGLEPKADGGSVHIRADVRFGLLEITVLDDGVGLSASAGRTGLALDNIRARLQARHGGKGALTLVPQAPGARAMITLPFVGAAVDSSHRA
ncbi:histidine kinase [Massilia sp. P8910]|uniref:sensor histidine kinase n=1 Tax=Massilia antarctica TaxID=2765360 RepID=UPI000A9812D8|nr:MULTISPECIES: histidine kinase [Massilia]MCE3607800.1 histidine kinase [Massilia antarctica]MCY0910616.1 histidine kinase [Massilia sp. H27-R4]